MADELSARALIRAAKESGRAIHADGGEWLVYELPPPSYDRRRGPSLVFEGYESVRVVRSFPAGWRELEDSELFGLSMGI